MAESLPSSMFAGVMYIFMEVLLELCFQLPSTKYKEKSAASISWGLIGQLFYSNCIDQVFIYVKLEQTFKIRLSKSKSTFKGKSHILVKLKNRNVSLVLSSDCKIHKANGAGKVIWQKFRYLSTRFFKLIVFA